MLQDNPKKDETAPALNPKFPVVEGRYQMTREWSITLPGKFNRRFEDDSLVIWRPGITVWIIVWNNDKKQSSQERCKAIREDVSPEAFELEEFSDGPIRRFAYRLTEKREKGVVHALYGFAFSDDGHVQMSVYFDAERDLDIAKAMWRGLKE